MSKVLTVPTHFNDIGELSEGFLDRVEQDILILYGPVAYEDGAEIEFAVLLADGTPALQGTGIVRAAVDGGGERVPETRYDVVVEQLQLEGRYEVVFERLILARQAVSERPEADEVMSIPPAAELMSVPPTEEVTSAAFEDAEPSMQEGLEVEPADDSAPDTVPPESSSEEDEALLDDDQDLDEEPATVIATVDPEAIMAEAAQEFARDIAEEVAQDDDEAVDEPRDDEEPEAVFEGTLKLDSMYAFEHGIASEPRVGMPVPMPSMAAPPDAPPSPPVLRLAEPPQGLTRPSLAQPQEALFLTDDEVSDVHTTGLFAYEDALPIPSRPPLPDPNRPRQVAAVEALDADDVEDAYSDDDEYEEVRLSDFAGTAEEG